MVSFGEGKASHGLNIDLKVNFPITLNDRKELEDFAGTHGPGYLFARDNLDGSFYVTDKKRLSSRLVSNPPIIWPKGTYYADIDFDKNRKALSVLERIFKGECDPMQQLSSQVILTDMRKDGNPVILPEFPEKLAFVRAERSRLYVSNTPFLAQVSLKEANALYQRLAEDFGYSPGK